MTGSQPQSTTMAPVALVNLKNIVHEANVANEANFNGAGEGSNTVYLLNGGENGVLNFGLQNLNRVDHYQTAGRTDFKGGGNNHVVNMQGLESSHVVFSNLKKKNGKKDKKVNKGKKNGGN